MVAISYFLNSTLERAELGIQLSSGKRVGGMLFADDFVGVSDSRESLQKLIDVVHRYCNKWRLKANEECGDGIFCRRWVEMGRA